MRHSFQRHGLVRPRIIDVGQKVARPQPWAEVFPCWICSIYTQERLEDYRSTSELQNPIGIYDVWPVLLLDTGTYEEATRPTLMLTGLHRVSKYINAAVVRILCDWNTSATQYL